MIRDLPRNNFKRAIAEGRNQIGMWLSTASFIATEAGAGAGFDWLLIDMEHSPIELPDVVHHLRASVGGTAEPMVRVPWNEPVLVKRLLDVGARTFMFPMVQSAAEARAAVAATRYPPAGIRGYSGMTRANSYGRISGYAARCAEEICIIVQIETPKALDVIPEIAAVDDVDGLFIGPADLACNMGFASNIGAKEAKDSILAGGQRIRAAGKPAGMLNFNIEEAKALFAAGFAFIAVGSDLSMVLRGSEQLVRSFKPEPAV